MNKKVLFLAVAFCLFIAGQAWAANPVYLPTKAVRGSDNIEWTYDRYGNMMSEKVNGTVTKTLEWQKLPNGEFVVTKDEQSGYKTIRSYDGKGMELSHRQWYSEFGSDTWVENWGWEAIVDANGIRTGLKTFNNQTQQLEINTAYTFDNKGRVTQLPLDEDDSNEVMAIVWGNELNEIISITASVYTFTNFVSLVNLEYWDAYSLNPLEGNKDPGENVLYAWQDNKLHSMFANIDVLYSGMTGAYACTIDNARGEWTKTLTIGGQEMEKTILTKLSNGGWTETNRNHGDETTITREYNEYGALIRDHNLGNHYGVDGELIPYEKSYNREYDTQGHPVKTVYSVNGSQEYEETYTEWVATGIVAPAISVLSVYPTITSGVVSIENTQGETVRVYNISGGLILSTKLQTVDLSDYPNGVYMVKVGGKTAKVVKK
jgi:hypothetical protein